MARWHFIPSYAPQNLLQEPKQHQPANRAPLPQLVRLAALQRAMTARQQLVKRDKSNERSSSSSCRADLVVTLGTTVRVTNLSPASRSQSTMRRVRPPGTALLS